MNDPQKDAFLKEMKDEYRSSEDQKRRQEKDQHNKKSVSDSDPDPHSHADSDIYLDLYSSEIHMHMTSDRRQWITELGPRTADIGQHIGQLGSTAEFLPNTIRVLCRGN